MVKSQIITLILLLPLCFGQFSIQGPSDGNRRAQGLKYSADKGIEYTDQAESLGTGGFSITGASDGNSDFKIQGATDGNSEFQIQGATDGNSEFQIHGPTDGGSQAYIHDYDQQQYQPAEQARTVEYKESNGNQVNWRSYNRNNEASQYEEPAPQQSYQRRNTNRRGQATSRVEPVQQVHQVQQAAQQEPRYHHPDPVGNVNYNPIEKAPPSIQEILEFQARIPYMDIVPEQLRIDALEAAKAQAQKFAEEYPKQVLAQRPPQVVIEEAPRSHYRSKPRPQTRERRQAPQYEQYQQQQQQDEVVYYQPQEYSVPQDYATQQFYEHQRRQAPQYEVNQSEQPQVDYSQNPQYAQHAQAYSQQQVYSHQQRRQAPKHDVYQQQREAAYYQQEEEKAQQQQQQQQNYETTSLNRPFKRLTQPQVEPQPTYSTNVPQQIQEILKFQAQIPYDIIANQIHYKPDKPYVPQAVQPQQNYQIQQDVQPSPTPAQYKPQADFRPQTFEPSDQARVYALKKQQLEQQNQYGYAQQQNYYHNQSGQRSRPLNIRQE